MSWVYWMIRYTHSILHAYLLRQIQMQYRTYIDCMNEMVYYIIFSICICKLVYFDYFLEWLKAQMRVRSNQF